MNYTEEEIQQKIKENQERQIQAVKDITLKAWEHGIEIKRVALQDNFEQEIGQFFYGDRLDLPAPKIKEIETDLGLVEVE